MDKKSYEKRIETMNNYHVTRGKLETS